MAIETVGVGQDEVEIARTADVSIVVLVPGMGDDVQALKAGVMEIADIFVVNKADREGTDRTVAEIESLLGSMRMTWASGGLRSSGPRRRPDRASIVDTITRFRQQGSAWERRRKRAEAQLRSIVGARLLRQVENACRHPNPALIDRIAARSRQSVRGGGWVIGAIEPRTARGEGPPQVSGEERALGPRDYTQSRERRGAKGPRK